MDVAGSSNPRVRLMDPQYHPKRLLSSQSVYSAIEALAGNKLAFCATSGTLRILCYHGVCEDELAEQPWIPQFFVTKSAFDAQLQYLRRNCKVLPLYDALLRLWENRLPRAAVSITFDDGYANNFSVAQILLKKYSIPATIFVATAYVESGELFPFDRLRLLLLYDESTRSRLNARLYLDNPMDFVSKQLCHPWELLARRLPPSVTESLRPLSRAELQMFDRSLIEIGSHTQHHCILTNERPYRRAQEIRGSIDSLEAWLKNPPRLFAFPNGQAADFDESDKTTLRHCGIPAALTTLPGLNRSNTDPFELRRFVVGLNHSPASVAAEVSGATFIFRTIRKFFESRPTESRHSLK
jgi:peptidoglycan/xylan/chitin deacetylase (PgdA/CDA1 family)